MRYQQKLRVDRYLAFPAALVANGVARLLAPLLRRNHAMGEGMVRTIVVAKWVGMGSILQAEPLLAALRRRYPAARIVFATAAANRALVERLPCIDEVVCFSDAGLGALLLSVPGAIGRLIALRADLYLDLEVYSAGASVLALASLARNRIGFYRSSTRFKRGIFTHLVFFNTHIPVSRLYLQLGVVAGAPSAPPGTSGLRVTPEDQAELRAALGDPPWGAGPYIVINPNASDLLLERRWPPDRFAAAMEALAAAGHWMVLTGAPAEAAYTTALADRLSPTARAHALNLAGRLRLGAFLELMRGSACVLTCDSGPMHMAFAMAAPAVFLFGPGNPEHYGHQAPHIENLYRPVICSPCVYESDIPPCAGNNVCMQQISVESVVAAVERRLRAQPPPPQSLGRRDALALDDAGLPLGLVARASIPVVAQPAE